MTSWDMAIVYANTYHREHPVAGMGLGRLMLRWRHRGITSAEQFETLSDGFTGA